MRTWVSGERGRKFVREVGSIVLGVLIAIGLGAVATELGWRQDVATARETLASELGEAVGQANFRVRISQCVTRRLDEIGRILDQSAKTGRLPPVGLIGIAPWYTWSSTVWENVVGTEMAGHLTLDEQRGYGGAYTFIRVLDQNNRQEIDTWAELYAMIGPGRPVTPDEVGRLRAALTRARFLNNFIGGNSVRFAQIGDSYQLRFDHDIARPNRTRDVSKSKICQQIPAYAGQAYGMAPLTDSIARALANPITRTDPR